MTLVSVVMAAWRPRSDWLHEAVLSAIAEQACDLEVIVVDDGNDARVSDMLRDVADPRLRFIRVSHCGPYATRNAGVNAARGDYVRFFDSDDVIVQGSTGRLLAAAQAKGVDTVAYGLTMMCDDHLRPERLVSADFEGHVAEDHLLGRFNVYIHGMLCPRSVLERAGPWDEKNFRLMGDRDLVQRLLEQAPVCKLEEVVTLYRRHGTSITRSSRPADAVEAGLQVLKGYFARHPEKRGTALEHAAYKNLHLYRSRQFFKLGEMGPSLRQLTLAARHDPAAIVVVLLRFIGNKITRRRR